MSVPHEHQPHEAEIISFEREGNERAITAFIKNLSDERDHTHGTTLAARIEHLLSSESDELEGASVRLQEMLHSTDVFGSEELYDRKVEQDVVFSHLVSHLQETKALRELREQRHAALRLTELRAAVPDDQTPEDSRWLDIIDRLFR